jgi:hypothetical protein
MEEVHLLNAVLLTVFSSIGLCCLNAVFSLSITVAAIELHFAYVTSFAGKRKANPYTM